MGIGNEEVNRISKYLESHGFIENGSDDDLTEFHYCTPDKKYAIYYTCDSEYIYLYDLKMRSANMKSRFISVYYKLEVIIKLKHMSHYFRKYKIDTLFL